MRIGLVQMPAEQVVTGNGQHYETYACAAAAAGCEVVIFSELSDSGYDLRGGGGSHRSMENTLAAVARAQRLWVVAGLREAGTPKDYNTLQVFSPDGICVAIYRKLHLFGAGAMDETRHFSRGREPVTVSIGGIPMGLAICFDLRFPALYRAYALSGAEVLVTVAAWPSVRIADWRLLQQARALENQAFTIGVNYCGVRAGVTFGGHSLVCGPDGRILLEVDQNEAGLFPCELDLPWVRQIRADFPVLKAGWHAAYSSGLAGADTRDRG